MRSSVIYSGLSITSLLLRKRTDGRGPKLESRRASWCYQLTSIHSDDDDGVKYGLNWSLSSRWDTRDFSALSMI